MEDNVFTKIIAGEIPSHKVYEDDKVLAFLDVHPMTEGHTLLIPKKHAQYLWETEMDDYNHLMVVARKIADRLKEVLNPGRVGMILDGDGVPHAHLHLVPITGDSFRIIIPNQDLDAEPDHEELAKVAEKIRF